MNALGRDKANTPSRNNVSVSRSPPPQQGQASAGRPPVQRPTPLAPASQHGHPEASPSEFQPVQPLPPPAVLVAQQNKDGSLDRLMSAQNFQPSDNNGKQIGYGENGMYKPYMFLEREGLQVNRQKLDVRCSMTSDEYMYCALALLHEKDTCDPRDRDDILAHIFAVATDILTRPWPAVRRWTQYVWDAVEKGRCKWGDYRYIQDARVRLCYMTAPGPVGASGNIGPRTGAPTPATEVKTVVCPEFNGPQGCVFSSDHDDGNIRYSHACAYCSALGRRSAHSFQRCRTRIDAITHANPGQTSDTRAWHQAQDRPSAGHGTSSGHGSRQPQGYPHAHSKNGY